MSDELREQIRMARVVINTLRDAVMYHRNHACPLFQSAYTLTEKLGALDIVFDAAEHCATVEHCTRNLLARIHHDGGHHTAKVGLEQSCKDAKEVVCHDRTLLDSAEYGRDRAWIAAWDAEWRAQWAKETMRERMFRRIQEENQDACKARAERDELRTEASDLRDRIGKFVALADAVSDVVWGGECGWEETGIKKLIDALRQHVKRLRDERETLRRPFCDQHVPPWGSHEDTCPCCAAIEERRRCAKALVERDRLRAEMKRLREAARWVVHAVLHGVSKAGPDEEEASPGEVGEALLGLQNALAIVEPTQEERHE